jgi:chromosome segregation ATPase
LIAGELDEIRAALEQADRARKAAENDLHDAADRISELSLSNANMGAQKRKLESDIAAMQSDLDEAIAELKNSEERVKKASADAARLAEELRQEQVANVYNLRFKFSY